MLKNLATYVLKKSLASVTDEDIMNAVKARCHTLKNVFVPDVTSLFLQNLKMNVSMDDCDARVFRYYEDFNAIMEDNGLQGLIGIGNEIIIPEGIVTSLRAVQPTLSSVLLSAPVEAEMTDGRRLVCDHELLLDLELTTLASLVTLRPVPCLILSGGGDKLLLGRDVLKGLGIDVEQQLAQLADPALLGGEKMSFQWVTNSLLRQDQL
ncbi:uncharacterized protein IUM83_02021 [Phytophthora cinnamomi]|uniref:uncharacterized protein n=1 Tax=Phytophthora cinnamomi TaxID=4785 RepID=UPI00355A29D4|nr:hypothetical protein IUM83_02021 [Phytophthora cinnamomi]